MQAGTEAFKPRWASALRAPAPPKKIISSYISGDSRGVAGGGQHSFWGAGAPCQAANPG